jgi:hypothetical protein
MAAETVKVKEVSGPNPRGWFEISLEDGRVLSSKSEEVVAVARNLLGAEVEADITEVQKGQYKNTYLNEINGVGDKPKASSGSRSAPSGGGGARNAETQRQIRLQWSYGRAVELLMASGDTVDFDDATKAKLDAWSEYLFDKTK